MKKLRKYIILALLMGLLGEIYFYPFESTIKFSAGVIAFNLIILVTEDISELLLSFFCGLAVFLIRNTFGVLFLHNSFLEALSFNLPSFFYYIFYGILVKGIGVKKYRDNLLMTIVFLALIDSISNIFEAAIRSDINSYIIRAIIFAGFTRSIIAYFIYMAHNKQKLFIVNREHQKRYTQLNMLISNIQAEMFYLKKSMKDIEKVMGKSYNLYNTYKNDKYLKCKTLDIAREVHEIKKDYFRVLKGFEIFMNNLENEETMTLSNIFTIIKDNTNRYLKENNKSIKICFSYKNDFALKSYYNLFTILNNLITNSIDFCQDEDCIKITEEEDEENIYFEVIDTGIGIEEEVISLIFNPGFTTKYDEETGKSSTGIGLSHVKNITEDLSGSIDVKSKPNLGTTFTLKIPKNSLIGG